MTKTVKIFAILLLAAGFGIASVPAQAKDAPASGTAAKAAIESFYTTLTGVMKAGNELGFSGRYRKLEPAIRKTFNLPLMTRFAVGPAWSQASAGEQQQLVSAFSDFSIATYASQFTKYDGEQFKVIDQKPASGGGVIVTTQLTPGGGGDPVSLDYLMRPDDKGAWRVVDVFMDGTISQLATRRAEFVSIVQRDGIPALVNELGEKSKQMGPS